MASKRGTFETDLYTADCSGKSYAWDMIIKLACSWLATDNGRQSEESVSVYPPSLYGVGLSCKTRGDIGLLTDRYVSNKLHGGIVSILERTLGFG